MYMSVEKMAMKITTDGSGQVCATSPILLLSSSGIEGKEHYIKDAYWCEKTTLFPATTITLLR